MIRQLLGRLVRAGLDRRGYVLWKREFLRFGVSPFLDIARLARATATPIEIVFDVGANVGQTAAEALSAFPNATVFAFEPHPETFRRLSQGLSNARLFIHQLALGDTAGEVCFYEYGTSGGASLMNSLVADARFPRQFGYTASTRTVQCATIDGFCAANGIERIDILKIDAEGCDLAVIKGAGRMFTEGRIGFVYTEFNDLVSLEGTTGGALLPIAEYLAPFGVHYVASYTDFILPDANMFVSANALFAKRGAR